MFCSRPGSGYETCSGLCFAAVLEVDMKHAVVYVVDRTVRQTRCTVVVCVHLLVKLMHCNIPSASSWHRSPRHSARLTAVTLVHVWVETWFSRLVTVSGISSCLVCRRWQFLCLSVSNICYNWLVLWHQLSFLFSPRLRRPASCQPTSEPTSEPQLTTAHPGHYMPNDTSNRTFFGVDRSWSWLTCGIISVDVWQDRLGLVKQLYDECYWCLTCLPAKAARWTGSWHDQSCIYDLTESCRYLAANQHHSGLWRDCLYLMISLAEYQYCYKYWWRAVYTDRGWTVAEWTCLTPPSRQAHSLNWVNQAVIWVIIIIISGFGIYGAAVVPDSGIGNTWQRLTLVLHEI